ncbi:MAG: PIG-L family deacetylase [bacterium]
MKRIHTFYSVGILVILSFVSNLQSQTVFSNPGPQAIGGILKDLQNGLTVLTISLRPGDEDFPLLASLRFDRGWKVKGLYITNGEALPVDTGDEPAAFLSGTRKMEAHRAMKASDIPAHFLNLPDPGLVRSTKDLDTLWENSLENYFATAIQRLKPHVIIVMPIRHHAADQAQLVQDYIKKSLLLGLIKAREKNLVWSEKDSTYLQPWNAQSVWLSENSSSKQRATLIPSKSSAAVAERALKYYRTRNIAKEGRDRNPAGYERIVPGPASSVSRFESGVQRTTAAIAPIQSVLENLRPTMKRSSLDSLVVDLIGQLDYLLVKESRTLSVLDKTILTQWKQDLDRLHFCLLNVRLTVSVSDSILAQAQLFYVTVDKLDPAILKGGPLYILFTPTYGVDWFYNEKTKNYLDVTQPDTFRVITPDKLQMTYPLHVNGKNSWKVGENFTFSLYHKDQSVLRSFIATYTVPLLHSPITSIQVSTPNVAWGDRTMGLRLFSASRDNLSGTLVIDDSLCQVGKFEINVFGKDYQTDALVPLPWNVKPSNPSTMVHLKSLRGAIDSFTVKRIDVSIDTTKRIGLISNDNRGIFAKSLERIGAQFEILDPSGDFISQIHEFATLLFDRGIDYSRWSAHHQSTIESWIEKGGRAVIMEPNTPFETARVKFQVYQGTSVESDITWLDSTSTVRNKPYALDSRTWQEWRYAKAWHALYPLAPDAKALLAACDGRLPLVIEFSIGHGIMVFSTINLEQQLELLHTEAYKLFCNLLSN